MNYFLRSFWALLLLATVSLSARAQTPAARQGRLNQLENAKIAYITDKVSLTQDQAQKFWPVYNDFTTKRKELNRQMRQLRSGNLDALSDQQIREGLDQAMTLREQEVKLEKEYFGRFQKILSIRQVGKLYGAERDFTREVIKRVADRRGGAGRGPASSGQADD